MELQKTCKTCGEIRTLGEYPREAKGADGLKATCTWCLRIKMKSWKRHTGYKSSNDLSRVARQNWVYDYLLANPCEDCKESDPLVLEFDHIHRKEKSGDVSKIARNGPMDALVAEVAKCRVLCACCHRRHTAKQMNYYSYRRQQADLLAAA